MFFSTFLLLSLVVSVVQMITVRPPNCDPQKLNSSIINLDVSQYSGMWYQKAATTIIPGFENLSAFFVDVTHFQLGEDTYLHFVLKLSYIGSSECRTNNHTCLLRGSLCSSMDKFRRFEIIVGDYQSASGLWAQAYFGDDVYASLILFSRDPHTQPDTTSIRNTLVGFCANWAADPTSNNYNIKLSYDNTPCLS